MDSHGNMDQEMETGDIGGEWRPSSPESYSPNAGINYPPLPEYPPSHWKYEMRREMQEICPNVYFGSYASATKKKLQELQEARFTHIVCVRHMMERRVIRPNFPDHFVYKVVEMNENCIESIIPQCLSLCEFVSRVLDSGGKILIHGNGGAGSSAILIIAFIMYRYGVSSTVAHNYVQQRRFCIRPTDGYLEQLRELEPIIRARQLGQLWGQSPDLTRPIHSGLKRNIEHVMESEGTVMKRALEDAGATHAERATENSRDGDGDHLLFASGHK